MQALPTVPADHGALSLDPFLRLREEWLDDIEVSAKTKKDYRAALDYFRTWLLAEGGRIESKTLQLYRDSLLERGLRSLSVATYLTAPQLFLEFLHARGVTPFVPRAKRPRVPRGHQKDTIAPDDLRRALAAIDTTALVGARDYALLILLAHTGVRTIEIERSLVEDLRTVQGRPALYIQGKGRAEKDDFVFLEPGVLEPLRYYLRARAREVERLHLPGNAPLFAAHGNRGKGAAISRRTLRHVIATRLAAVDAKTERITAHSFRHTAATQALLGGAELMQVRDMLRHANVQTTMVYVHNLEREKKRAEQFVDFGLPQFSREP